VGPDQVEPSFVQKLTKTHRTGALVFEVRIAVGFNCDDPVDDGVDRRSPNGIGFSIAGL
jgi:hypothetical protein